MSEALRYRSLRFFGALRFGYADSADARCGRIHFRSGVDKELTMQALHDFWAYVPPGIQYVVIGLVIFAVATAVAIYKLLHKK